MQSLWEQGINVHEPLKNRTFLGKKLVFNFFGCRISRAYKWSPTWKTACIRASRQPKSAKSEKKKRTRTMCQICSKLTVKTPEQHQVLLLLMNIAEFEQINASWAWETIVSDNKLIFSNCLMGFDVSLYSPNLGRSRFLWQNLKKLSQTLYISMSISIYLSIYLSICINIYIYIYIYIYICIYIIYTFWILPKLHELCESCRRNSLEVL